MFGWFWRKKLRQPTREELMILAMEYVTQVFNSSLPDFFDVLDIERKALVLAVKSKRYKFSNKDIAILTRYCKNAVYNYLGIDKTHFF